MKKIGYCFAAMVLFVLLSGSAQGQHRIGITGGLNFANVSAEFDDATTDVATKTVLGFGALVDLHLDRAVSLYLRPMYLQKGTTVKDLEDQIDFPIKMSFLSLSAMLKAEFGETIRPYLMLGPTIGYLLSSDIDGEAEGFAIKADLKDVTESIDFGLSFGAGIGCNVKRARLFVESRYELGLSNLQKGGSFELSAGPIVDTIVWDKEEDKYKSRGILVMAGISLPLGGE